MHVEAEPEVFHRSAPTEAGAFFRTKLSEASHLFWIAELEDEIVGYIWAEDRQHEGGPFTKASRTVFINHIVVIPHIRRRGVGRALVTACEVQAQRIGAREVALTHWSFNRAAGQFFRDLGFEGRTLSLRRHLPAT